jgi:hypothetical protein
LNRIIGMIQPQPLSTRILRMLVAGQWVTTLVRFWAKEDTVRCRLCERGQCKARDGSCIFMIKGFVKDEDAPLYSLVGARRQDGKGGFR